MTFTLSEDLATRLLRTISGRNRSRYVTEAIEARLRERDERLINACETANLDPDARAIEGQWDDLAETLAEPWTDATPR